MSSIMSSIGSTLGLVDKSKEIQNIIEDVETEGYGEYFEKVNDVLNRLGFVNDKVSNDNIEIIIDDKFPNYEEYKNIDKLIVDPIIKIKLTNKKTNKVEVGNIKLSSLPNYVNNYQLFEELTRIKKLLSN